MVLQKRRVESSLEAGCLGFQTQCAVFSARRSFGLLPVNLATVADADHLHYEPVVMNFVDDPVVPGAHPVHIRFTDQSDAFVRSRFAGKKVDDRPNPLLIIAR